MIGLLLPSVLSCTPTPPPTVEYLVHVGDTLSHVAARFAVPGGWPALAEINQIDDPHAISPEQILQIPVAHLLARGEDPGARQRPLPVPDAPPPERACAVSSTVVSLDAEGCLPLHSGFLCTGAGGLARENALPPGRPLLANDPDAGLWSMTVHQVDLDGDGQEEVVAQRYTGTSNGIALVHFDVEVVSERSAPRSVVDAVGLSFAGTRERGCDLLVHDFGYAPDLRSGAQHAYLVEYPMAWEGGRLVPLSGAWFSRMFGDDRPRAFRLRTQRSRPAGDALQHRGTIEGVTVGPYDAVFSLVGAADVRVSGWSTLGAGDEPASSPLSARIDWAEMPGRSLRCTPGDGVCWVR